MIRPSRKPTRRRARLALAGPERLEERALLSFGAGDIAAFGASGLSATPIETSAVAIDAAGNRYVSGSFVGNLTIGSTSLISAGGRDAFVAKFGADGSLLFARSAGGLQDDSAGGVAVDAAGNAYVAGSFGGNAAFGGPSLSGSGAFVWSLTPTGATRYAAGAAGGSASGVEIAASADGSSVAVGGSFRGALGFGSQTLVNNANGEVGFIAKLDASGQFSWAVDFPAVGPSSSGKVLGVALDPTGAVISAGAFSGSVDFQPGPGTMVRTSQAGSADIAAVKLDANGQFGWAFTTGGSGLDAATGVAVDGKGKVFVTGAYQGWVGFGTAGTLKATPGMTSFFVLGLGANGATNFATDLGASSYLTDPTVAGPSVAVNGVGNVVVASTFTGVVKAGRFTTDRGPGHHALVESIDPSGKIIRAYSVGGSGQQTVTGVAIDSKGDVAFTGLYSGLLGFGDQSFLGKSASGPSAFVAELNPESQAPNDFFGTTQTQPAVYNPTTQVWSVQGPFGSGTYGTFGQPGDISVPGDYEGNGTTQMAVFRPSTAQWIVQGLNGPRVVATFGGPNLMDIPAPADFDGVGYTQPAVFRPSTGEWFVLGPNGSRALGVFGGTNLMDLPVPADYDGDGRAEPAVFRPATAQWFVKGPTGGRLLATFGATNLTDLPAPGDFNGDGKAEPAVFRQSTGEWFALLPTGGRKVATFGATNGSVVPANGASSFNYAFQASRPRPTPTPPTPTPLAPVVVNQPIVTAPLLTRRPLTFFRGRR